MAEEERTYEGIQQDKNAVDILYYTLRNLGEEVEYDPKTIVDTFLTKHRYFETNLGSSVKLSNQVDELDERGKQFLAYSLQEIKKLPMAGSSGGAPLSSAVADYALAGILDPTNIASVVAGMFTFGSGGIAGIAAKESAKAIAKKKLLNKLKLLGVEGSIAAAGGSATNYKVQEVEQKIGRRGDIDLGEVGLQGLIEGVASPIVGAGITGIGKGISKAAQKLTDTTGIDKNIESAKAWLERNLLPTAGVDETQRRLIERRSGEVSSIKKDSEDLSQKLDDIIKTEFNTPEGRQLINSALEGNKKAITQINNTSPETGELLNQFFNLRKDAFEYGRRSYLDKKTKKIFNKNSNYVRNVPEAYSVMKRQEKFDDFITDEILNDLRKEMLADPTNVRWQEFTSKYINDQGKEIKSDAEIESIVKETAKKLYKPDVSRVKEAGAFKTRKEEDELGPALKKILGYNYRPALRVTETISGIVDTASKTNAAADIAADALNRGIGVEAKSAAEASAKLGSKDVVRLTGAFEKGKNPAIEDTIIRIPDNRSEDYLKNIWVEKNEALKVKELFDDSFFLKDFAKNNKIAGSILSTFSGAQTFAKAGKTVYSPIAFIRNMLGAVGYTATSGNVRGISDGFKNITTLTKNETSELIDEARQLGITGSNIDLQQVLRRFGDLSSTLDDGRFYQKVLESGGLALVPKYGNVVAKAAKKAYGDIDDGFKIAAYQNEKVKADKIFNGFSKEQQDNILQDFKTRYNLPDNIKNDQLKKEYIKESATIKALNTTPIYGRVSPILEKARQLPVIGTFTAYPAERLRNVYNTLKIATDELKDGFETGNKELTKSGMARLGQFYAAQGAFYTAAYGLNEATGATELLDEMRNLLPDWEKDDALVVTGQDKKGNVKYINLSYIHPDDNILSSIMPMALKASRGEDVSEDIGSALLKSSYKLVEPYVSRSLALEAGQELYSFITDPTDEALLKFAKIMEPGYAKISRDMAMSSGALSKLEGVEQFFYPTTFGQTPEKAEDFVDFLAKNALAFPGMKEQVFNPKRALGFALSDIKNNYENSYGEFKTNLTKTLSDPRSRLDLTDIISEYNDILQEQFEAQKLIKKVYSNVENMYGTQETKRFLNGLDLKSIAGSKKKVDSILYNNTFSPVKASETKELYRDLAQKMREDFPGSNFDEVLQVLQDNMRNLESYYADLSLLKNAPDLQIGEE